jgi:hypothetical protein
MRGWGSLTPPPFSSPKGRITTKELCCQQCAVHPVLSTVAFYNNSLTYFHLFRWITAKVANCMVKFSQNRTRGLRGGAQVYPHSFFNLGARCGVEGSQRHVPAALLLGKTPGTNRKGGWVVPGAGLDGVRKISPSPQGFDPLIVQT